MSKFLGLSFSAKGRTSYAFWLPALLFFLLVSGTTTLAQTSGITYKATNLSMSKALKEVRIKAKLKLSYNTALISKQAPVTVDAKGVSVEVLLQKILANSNLKFVADQTGGYIIYEPEIPALPTGKEEVNGKILQGRVTDPSGNPLAGVSIRSEQSKSMTVTQADGFFTLLPYLNEQVIFSRIGMKTLSYKVKGNEGDLMIFKMDTIAREIAEVVVNGYQKIDPRLATGSVFKLKAADIMQAGQPSVDQMLQGKVPGLMVVNTTGSVNGKPTLRLRGTSTLLGNAQPLWVIDGMIRPNPVDISSAVLNNVISNASQSNFELMGNAISGVNPYDIESITVLKDAAATAIYGTSAANGVIVVTTKRGKAGPMQISYNTNVSFSARPSYNRLNLMNSKERVLFSKQMQEDGVINSAITTGVKENISYEGLLLDLYARNIDEATFNRKVGELESRNTDWFKLLFRNQVSMQHALSISGGNAKTTYYASINFGDNKSAAIKDGRKSYSANLNLRSDIGKKVTLDVTLNSSYINSTGYYSSANPLTYALQTNRGYSPDVFYPIRSSALDTDTYGYLDARKRLSPLLFNIQNEIDHTENTSSVRSTSLNLSLDYKIGKGWVFRHNSSVIMDDASGITSADDKTYYVSTLRGWNYGDIIDKTTQTYLSSRLPNGGIADLMNSNSQMFRMKNSIDYSRGLFDDRDQFNFTLGNEIISQKSNGVYSTEPGFFPDRGKIFFPSDMSRKYLSKTSLSNDLKNSVSYYGTAAYSFMNRYIISGTIRTDGSNRFGQYSNSKFLPNYSVSGRWNAGAEKWFPVSSVISEWQITASYGTQGNVVTAVGPQLVATYSPNEVDMVTQIPFLNIKSLPYPDLRWEKTGQWNFGTTASFLDSRLIVTAEYYKKKTTDVLDNIDIPMEYGRRTMYRNGSELYNSGVELSVTANIVRRKNTSFSVNILTSKNNNKVSDKANLSNYNSLFDGSGHLGGKAISGFYSYIFKGLDHNNGLPTFDKLDGPFNNNPDAFLVYSGQTFPKISGSISPSFRYKSFTIGALLYVSVGSSKRLNEPYMQALEVGTLPAPYTNLSRDYFNRWRKPGDELFTNIPGMMGYISSNNYITTPYAGANDAGTKVAVTVNPYTAYNLSDLRVLNNNFLRCNTINLSYGIPAPKLTSLNIKGASVGFTVNNVFTLANSKLNGQDPEIDGVGTIALPKVRQYVFTLNATF